MIKYLHYIRRDRVCACTAFTGSIMRRERRGNEETMENYREEVMARMGRSDGKASGVMTPDAQEARRLRNQLVEYDGYLREMRKSNMKNVETLDVIQRYTDKSAEGIQGLTEEGAAGMQKLAEESLNRIQQLAAECSASLRQYTASSDESRKQVTEEGLARYGQLSVAGLSELKRVTEESLEQIRRLTEESSARMEEMNTRNIETAEHVNAVRGLVEGHVDAVRGLVEDHVESMREMQKQADEFNHRENVKVYRNVQAVVVEEVKKQTDELRKESKGVRPLLILTLLAALTNIALFVLQLLGIIV